jgi:hypothetical protein
MLDGQRIPRKPVGGRRPGAGRPPGAPNKLTRPVRELASDYSEECIHRLVHLSQHAESEQVRLAANIAVLDRAHGRPRQEIDLTKDERITVIVNRDKSMGMGMGESMGQRPALEDHSTEG